MTMVVSTSWPCVLTEQFVFRDNFPLIFPPFVHPGLNVFRFLCGSLSFSLLLHEGEGGGTTKISCSS